MTVDVSDLQAVKNFAEELPSDFRDIDILVNNAGMIFCSAYACFVESTYSQGKEQRVTIQV